MIALKSPLVHAIRQESDNCAALLRHMCRTCEDYAAYNSQDPARLQRVLSGYLVRDYHFQTSACVECGQTIEAMLDIEDSQ